MKNYIIAVLFYLLVAFISPIQAQPHFKKVKNHLKELIEQEYLLGASVAYIQSDGEVQYFSFGDPVRDDFEFNKNTIYEIGSVSKTFTSLILARMVQQGLVSLDTPIDAILPDSVRIEPYDSTGITLLNLATHTSGLPRLPTNFEPKNTANPYASYTIEKLYQFLDNYQISRKPGSKVAYSNVGVGLLGHLLVLKSGMTYKQLLHHYISKPLNMTSTYIEVSERKQSRFAAPYHAGTNAHRWELPPAFVAAGGVRSTVSDLVTYLKAQMGFIDTNFDDAIAMTHEIYFNKSINNLDATALAWFYATKHDTLIFHGGATGGYRAFIGWNSEAHRGAVILASGATTIADIGMHLLDKRYKLSEIQKAVQVDAAVLSSYTGFYKITPLFGIKVFMKDGHLMAEATGQKSFHIYPESETRFFYKAVKAEIEFIKNKEGEVTKLKLYQAGRVLTGIKTKEN